MDNGGVLFLLGGGVGIGLIFGLVLSLLLWRDGSTYPKALITGQKLGLSFGLSTAAALMLLGDYETWTR